MNPRLPASEVARLFRHGGCHAVYARRENGRIVLSDTRELGCVHVGNYTGAVDCIALEEAADDALTKRGL